MNTRSLSAHIRYRFDNVMARGVSAQIGLLLLATGAVILVGAVAAVITGVEQNGGFGPTLWTSLLHVVDSGNISADGGNNKLYILVMLLVTLAGLTVVAALFGIVTNGITDQMQVLRRGRSAVVERDHTLVLGWSPQIFQIVSELMVANENQRRGCVVILSDRDKPEMEQEIRERVERRGRTRVICRTGNPLDLNDLEIGSPRTAKAIIVLPPAVDDPDTHVIKTLLAITHHPKRRPEPYHIVAPIHDPRNLEVAEIAGRGEAQLVLDRDLISRITVQTCRQSGLSVVYTELLDFDGDEIYFRKEPGLVGKTFGEALFAYEDSAVIGMHRGGESKVNPEMDTVIAAGDTLIAISRDDDTIKLSGKSDYSIDADAICDVEKLPAAPERTIIFNWNSRTALILSELNSYVTPGSCVCLVVRDLAVSDEVDALRPKLVNLQLEAIQGDPTDRGTLEGLSLDTYDHVIVLGESDTLGTQTADARTLTTLLHLRNMNDRDGTDFSVVSEMADLRNRELASATRADDFIVSDQLVSLILSQLSENPHLQAVFDDLFDAEGSEIYLKPVEQYLRAGRPINFYTVLEAARRRGEIAIGYRIDRLSDDADADYGVVVNPVKSQAVTFTPRDRVIVLAAE